MKQIRTIINYLQYSLIYSMTIIQGVSAKIMKMLLNNKQNPRETVHFIHAKCSRHATLIIKETSMLLLNLPASICKLYNVCTWLSFCACVIFWIFCFIAISEATSCVSPIGVCSRSARKHIWCDSIDIGNDNWCKSIFKYRYDWMNSYPTHISITFVWITKFI